MKGRIAWCMRAKPCPTLCNPMDYSPPGSSVHGDFPGKIIGVDCHFLLQEMFLTHRLNLCLLHLLPWQADSLPQSHLEAQNCMGVTNNGTGIRLIIFETQPCPQGSLGLSFLIYKMGIREVYIRHLQDYRRLSMNCTW